MAELKQEHDSEVASLREELQAAQDRIKELTIELSILSASSSSEGPKQEAPIAPVPERVAPARLGVRRSSSPELKSSSLEQLMGALVRKKEKVFFVFASYF